MNSTTSMLRVIRGIQMVASHQSSLIVNAWMAVTVNTHSSNKHSKNNYYNHSKEGSELGNDSIIHNSIVAAQEDERFVVADDKNEDKKDICHGSSCSSLKICDGDEGQDFNTNSNNNKNQNENSISALAEISRVKAKDGDYGDTGLASSDDVTNGQSSQETNHHQQHQINIGFDERASAVPSSKFLRAAGFAKLGVGLAYGTIVESASRLLNTSESSSASYPAVASDANADRLAATLCRMRGAALKIGQMLSIQDETTVLPPPLAHAMQSVRAGANPMPEYQLMSQLNEQLGESWRDSFLHFNEKPIAAASIGQVHEGILLDGKKVAIKVQYPGVANSIESDLSNLEMLMRLSGLAPKGLFLEEIIRVARKELIVECDYIRESQNHRRFQELLQTDIQLSQANFVVPGVIDDLSTSQILTTEYAPGGTIEKVSGLSQEERNRIGRNILRLTIRELFEWRFMQTDPNWGNFLYDIGSRTTSLIDFGAAREFDKKFVDSYLKIVWANANKDRETLLEESHRLGFLTGKENDLMINAHVQSGFVVGEPFADDEPFDFRASKISARMSEHGSVFMKHRLT